MGSNFKKSQNGRAFLLSPRNKYCRLSIFAILVLQGILVLRTQHTSLRSLHIIHNSTTSVGQDATQAHTEVSITEENLPEEIPTVPDGHTCQSWLSENDDVKLPRNFTEEPIVVGSSDGRVWDDCDVPCLHIVGVDRRVDGQFHTVGGGGQMSILRSMEPRSYYPINDVAEAMNSGYQVVMTVHLNSHVPVGYFSWEEYDIMKPIPEKTADGLAVAFISNCNANNFRAKAVTDLQKYLKVDSYGSCVGNKPRADDKMGTIMKYKFCLSFENSCEEDYLTEKYLQSLVAGCVPVVIGPPNIDDFAPSNNSIIHFQRIEDTEEVAMTMKRLDQNNAEWLSMMSWKKDGPSDKFKALLDMSTVHSSCRLCIHLADRLVAKKEAMEEHTRPCRCRDRSGSVTIHIYVRERGRFRFKTIFLKGSELTVEALHSTVLSKFDSEGYVPVWTTKRPKVLVKEGEKLRIYRIYPASANQREALHGNAWFSNTKQFVNYVNEMRCPKLEVIFV